MFYIYKTKIYKYKINAIPLFVEQDNMPELPKMVYFCARVSSPLFICLPVKKSYIKSCGVSTIVDAPFLFLRWLWQQQAL